MCGGFEEALVVLVLVERVDEPDVEDVLHILGGLPDAPHEDGGQTANLPGARDILDDLEHLALQHALLDGEHVHVDHQEALPVALVPEDGVGAVDVVVRLLEVPRLHELQHELVVDDGQVQGGVYERVLLRLLRVEDAVVRGVGREIFHDPLQNILPHSLKCQDGGVRLLEVLLYDLHNPLVHLRRVVVVHVPVQQAQVSERLLHRRVRPIRVREPVELLVLVLQGSSGGVRLSSDLLVLGVVVVYVEQPRCLLEALPDSSCQYCCRN